MLLHKIALILPHWDCTKFSARNKLVTPPGDIRSYAALSGLDTLKYTHMSTAILSANSQSLGGEGSAHPKSRSPEPGVYHSAHSPE